MKLFQENDQNALERIFEVHMLRPVSLDWVKELVVPFSLFGTTEGKLAFKLCTSRFPVVWYLDDANGFQQPSPEMNQFHFVQSVWSEMSLDTTRAQDDVLKNYFTKISNGLPNNLRRVIKTSMPQSEQEKRNLSRQQQQPPLPSFSNSPPARPSVALPPPKKDKT